MPTLRHQFSCHAFREARLGMTRHRKGAARGKPLRAALAFVKMIVPLAPWRRFVSEHESSGLLTDQKCAEGGVSKCFEGHQGSASVMPLRKMPGTRPSMLCTTSVGAPSSRTTFWNGDSTAAGSLASQAYRRTPCVVSRRLQDGFIRISGGDADMHVVFREELGATRADPGTAPDNEATSCTEGRMSPGSDRVMFHAPVRVIREKCEDGQAQVAPVGASSRRSLRMPAPVHVPNEPNYSSKNWIVCRRNF